MSGSRRPSPPGSCSYCGRRITRQGATRHLSACAERKAVIAEADTRVGSPPVTLYQLRARDAWSGTFRLDLEIPGAQTLEVLDDYLRAIWLECCGHLSMFRRGGWGSDEIPMNRKIYAAFEDGDGLTHIYDFGTESVTLIKPAAKRKGSPTTPNPVALMARNLTPEEECIECGRPAGWLCMECVYAEQPGTLCDAHARAHPHEEYGEPVPLVNSPRVGMCGYEGPAEPPY